MDREIGLAIEVLRKGGIILYHTDTVWGIGCDATNEEAVAKIYALKRSEDKHAMLVLCRDADMVVRYVDKAPGIAFEVMEMATKPLTLILPGATGLAKNLIPEAKEGLNKFKMEAAGEVGVNLKQGYNGDLTSRQAGSIGGQMVKKMVEKYENDLQGKN